MTKAITDSVLDRISEPDRSELANLGGPGVDRRTHSSGSQSLPPIDARPSQDRVSACSQDHRRRLFLSGFPVREAGREGVSQAALREFMMALRDHDPWSVAVLYHSLPQNWTI
jgi:hypothetical protein